MVKLLALLRRMPADIVAQDADALMRAYGTGAYGEARTRARSARQGRVIDSNRSKGHWDKVRLEIARRTGKEIGADGATRRLADGT
jgi:hypothetical protein